MQGLISHRALFVSRRALHGHKGWNNWRLYSSSSSAAKPEEVPSDEANDQGRRFRRGGTKPVSSEVILPSSSSSSSWLDKLVYSSYLEKFMPPKGYKERLREKYEAKVIERDEMVGKTVVMPPVSLKYLMNSQDEESMSSQQERVEETSIETDGPTPVQFPFKVMKNTEFIEREEGEQAAVEEPKPVVLKSVADRLRLKEIDPETVLDEQEPHSLSDVFEAAAEVCIADAGTPDPNCPPSNVPCGGCGALLHCQDRAIPGYIASEKFKNAKKADLMADVCYRCSVLEAHQATLNVNVKSEDYPRIVSKIREQFAMILLIVDLTDFPCSIWPGILDIIGSRRPIILVGNKVDLLPQDSPDYLKRVEDGMIKCAVDVGMLDANIIHTALVSAKTGYGVENLITSIFNLCKGKGDIFIMGCTNVGKSSLFNTFLQSDLCAPQASDLVQRATISQWPGTTLNLLKFPLTPSSGWRKYLRYQRLTAEKPLVDAQEKERQIQFELTRDLEYKVLSGHVGKTFNSKQKEDAVESAISVNDIFHVNPRGKAPPPTVKPGQWDPNHPDFRQNHWVYDTPGAVNSNQILDLLTLPELMQSLPKTLIQPRSFYIKQNMSFFIGGLARIDFLDGPYPIRYTLFSNSSLPVTMSLVQDADAVYQKALGTKVFSVPCGGADRLSQFPPLESKTVELDGTGHTYSCADIVLSSIGWVAVTVGPNQRVRLAIHTPNGKGIFVRQPALLPYAVNYKGKRARGTYSYQPHDVYVAPRNYRKRRSIQSK